MLWHCTPCIVKTSINLLHFTVSNHKIIYPLNMQHQHQIDDDDGGGGWCYYNNCCCFFSVDVYCLYVIQCFFFATFSFFYRKKNLNIAAAAILITPTTTNDCSINLQFSTIVSGCHKCMLLWFLMLVTAWGVNCGSKAKHWREQEK